MTRSLMALALACVLSARAENPTATPEAISAEQRRQVERWIEGLGDAGFATREENHRKLSEWLAGPECPAEEAAELLEQLAERRDDPEIRTRLHEMIAGLVRKHRLRTEG